MQSPSKFRITVLLLLALAYLGLIQKYRAYDIDNSWFLSFSYNYCHSGIQSDTFMQVRYPYGMDGVHLFGKLAADTQCLVLNRTAWTPQWICRFNMLVVIAALWLLWSCLQRLGYREKWIAAFILLLGIMEPIVSMVEKARYEVFAFFLLFLAFRLGVQGWELAAALVALLAVETEPAAIVVPLLLITLLAVRTRNRKLLALKLVFASVAMVAFYLILHPGAIPQMLHSTYPRTSSIDGGTFFVYFIQRHRHLPELAVLLLGSWLYWKHRKAIAQLSPQRHVLVVSLSLISLAFLFAGLHPNASYLAFAMPFLLWIAMEGFDHASAWRWVPALLFAGIILQYAYLLHRNWHQGFRPQDIAAVRRQIAASAATLGLTDTQLRICGDYSLWSAHPENYAACSPRQPQIMRAANLFLCFDGRLMSDNLSASNSSCAQLDADLPLRQISEIDLRGHLLHVEVKQ